MATKVKLKQSNGGDGSILIRGRTIFTSTQNLEQTKLRFYPENPRVYSVVHGHGKLPAQEEIQNRLFQMEHVKVLVQDIRANGGLIEPLIVRDGTFEVLEGNSRLAAYRFLAKTNPMKWGYVKCTVLPADTFLIHQAEVGLIHQGCAFERLPLILHRQMVARYIP